MRTAILLMLVIIGIAAAALTSSGHASSKLYPCERCHLLLRVSGRVHSSEYHGINLTAGAHAGLVCADCHVPPRMSELRGGASVADYYAGDYKALNVVCEGCHRRVYRDYIDLVHGNKTILCPGEENILVKGYKGVGYWLHICRDYYHLKAEPARGCVECHNPHDPHYKPLSPLPPPSRRPPPPDEETVAYGTIGVVVASLALIGSSLLAERRRGGGSG